MACLVLVPSGELRAEVEPGEMTALSSRPQLPAEACGRCYRHLGGGGTTPTNTLGFRLCVSGPPKLMLAWVTR